MNIQPLGLNARSSLIYFAALGDIDIGKADWEKDVINTAAEFFYVPRSSSAIANVQKLVDEAFEQYMGEGTLPEWVFRALECIYRQLVVSARQQQSPPPH